ncbi:unnamed protein product [Orchesella dallaii]|uniref:Uncharacterized protein n=1 Tax=Orchesella dallaii TaxID=48710 RepID=A0ABP1Q184_9HEXA
MEELSVKHLWDDTSSNDMNVETWEVDGDSILADLSANTSEKIKQSIGRAMETFKTIISKRDFEALATKTDEHCITRATWIVNAINSEKDLEELAWNAECFVDLDENIRLRFSFVFDLTDDDDDGAEISSLSFCVTALPKNSKAVCMDEDEMKEELTFSVKVDRLTETLTFDYCQLPETPFTIWISSTNFLPKILGYQFLTYNASAVPTPPRKMYFGITITHTRIHSIIQLEKLTGDGCGKLRSLRPQICPSDNLFEMKLTAKTHVKLDAKNFFLAAQSQSMTTKLELLDNQSENLERRFNAETFLPTIIEWVYLGEMKEGTGKLVQNLLSAFNTSGQVTEFRTQLEDEVLQMSYGRSHNSRKEKRILNTNLRISCGKKLAMRRIIRFIGEFTRIIDDAVNRRSIT